MSKADARKLSKPPLSEDENAKKLALKYDCDLVVSHAAFVHLLYHLSNSGSIDSQISTIKMPFSVKEDAQTKKRVVYVEKPLLENNLNMREKNEKLFKRALHASVVKQKPHMSRYHRTASFSNKQQLNKATSDESNNIA